MKISRARMKRIADVATNQRSVVKGCGAISQSLASKICDVLNIPHTTSGAHSSDCFCFYADVLVVFAIGLSGIRGLVAVYPDDKLRKYFRLGTMNGERLVYRASMEIQKDGPLQVEVYKVSRPPTSSHLSWSIIAQLLSLGVDYKVCTLKALWPTSELTRSPVVDQGIAGAAAIQSTIDHK